MYPQLSFSDFLGWYSVYLAELNLKENREQSAHNDVSLANDRQAAYLLEELGRKFEEQNKILSDQNEMLRKILEAVRDEENS